jgi:hypothetical protein
MKVLFLLMLIVGAAVCSIGGTNTWDDWREESRHARQEARRAHEEARREARQAIEHARRAVREAHRQAFESRMEMRREERQFLPGSGTRSPRNLPRPLARKQSDLTFHRYRPAPCVSLGVFPYPQHPHAYAWG